MDASLSSDWLPGKYQLYGERFGYARQGLDEHPGGYLSAVVIGDGINSENLLFRLQPGATISGLVLDEFNEAVRGAEVMLFHHTVQNGKLGTYIAGQIQSDDRGSYKFSPLMAGTYYVVISARPWYAQNAQRALPRDETMNVAFPLTYFANTSDASEASAINLHTGEAFRADFNLRAVSAGHIRIPVTKGQEEQAAVTLFQKLFDDFDVVSPSLQEMSPNEGRVISGFAPGRYTLRVEAPGGDKGTSRSQTIDLYGDTTLDLHTIGGAATASITGIARAEGLTLKNAYIQFRNRDSDEAEGGRIGDDGKFQVEMIPAGTYEVSVGNSAGVYLASMAASNAKSNGRTLEISPGADVRMAILLAKGIGEITGTALFNDKGFSGALVLLVPDDPRNHVALFRRDQSDSDGTFSLKQVVPGRYTLLAIQDGWDLEWTDPKVLKPFLPKGTSVQVEPSGNYDVRVVVQSAK